jgi:hypothetical protein
MTLTYSTVDFLNLSIVDTFKEAGPNDYWQALDEETR